MDMPKVRFGTFAGKNLQTTSLIGTAQLSPQNSLGVNPNGAGTRRYGSLDNAPLKFTPDSSPGVDTKGGNKSSEIITTTDPTGNNPTLGDTPVSHVTPEPVFLTPSALSRSTKQWEGNITGNTIPKTATEVIRVNPRIGFYSGRD
jgi:hypothetical protein